MKKMLVLLLVMFVLALSSTVSANFNPNNILNQDSLMFSADRPDGPPPDQDDPPGPNEPSHHRHHHPEPPHDPPPDDFR